MVSQRRRFAAGAALVCVAALVSSILAGCSFVSEPPEPLVREAAKVASDLRKQPGVASARSDVSEGSWRHPHQRFVSLGVTLRDAGGLAGPATKAATTVDGATFAQATDVTLDVIVPGGPGLAPVSIEDSRGHRDGAGLPAAVAAADALRRLPTVAGATLSWSTASVRMAAVTAAGPTPLADTAASLRGLDGFGTGRLSAVEVDWPLGGSERSAAVEVAAEVPLDPLIATLEELSRRPDVSRIAYREQRSEDRPHLDIETGRPEAVADLLAAVVDPAADRLELPRTAFVVHAAAADRSVTGFVGLPLGAATPEPDWRAVDDPPLPAEEAAGIRSDYEAGIRAFLMETAVLGKRAGGPPPDADPTTCATADDGSVHCDLLLPLWHEPGATEEYVEARYASITAAWRRAGLSPSERALGTEIWTPGAGYSGPPGIELARLRGTTDGIRIDVSSSNVR
ncbi:hypothetical protein [Leifsonia sp. EB34]|uniref:hypothetical protein n=1 Tax=Leifsonia sp. EB34 TaxID=3156303 RepID=UPI0035190CBD